MKKNAVLVDFKLADNWDFIEIVERKTQMQWETLCLQSNQNHGGVLQQLIRYAKYFIFPMKICFLFFFLKINLRSKITLYTTNSTTQMPNTSRLLSKLLPAKGISNKMGAPNAMAGICCITRLFAAGVSKLGSISLSKIIPVDAVPVSIPK